MSTQPFESRIAHIEGVNVQIADRLNGIDGRLDSLDRSLRTEVGALRSEMNVRFGQIDQKFMWVIGVNVTSWTTIMLAVLFRH